MPTDTDLFKKNLSQYGQILVLETSPFNLSQDVILIGLEDKLLLGHLKIDETLDVDITTEFKHSSRCTALGISPETSLGVLPNIVIFASGGNDFVVRYFKSDLRDESTCKELLGHSSYINDVKFDPENSYFVSVSDDNTARVWSCESNECSAILRLTSPGMSACWHRDDCSKLLIAEKCGLIRFYNVETQTPILSLDCGKPLASAHWAPSESQLVASLQLGELLIWDLSKPCLPISNSLVFTESGGYLRFNSTGEFIAAVNNLENNLKIVSVHNQHQRLTRSVTIPSNICWHFRVPVVCFGDYKTLYLWKITSK